MLFASDLDNTIIYSYKNAEYGDVCVEVKDGKKLSFMPPDSFSMLSKVVEKCIFVPVTTRSFKQYRRINLGVYPRYALVAHGAILLIGGQADELWLSETRSMFETRLPKLRENEFIFDIRYVDEFFVFAKSKDPQLAVEHLKSIVDAREFEVCAVHNKVYVFPNGLNKGVALDRLKKRLNPQTVICAGDSVLDIPMLKMADAAIVPASLELGCDNAITLDEQKFVHHVLPTVYAYMNLPR